MKFVVMSQSNLDIFKNGFQIWNQRLDIAQDMSILDKHQFALKQMMLFHGHQLIFLSNI